MYIPAGETSGDQLGEGLIHALRARYPDAQFAGIGGPLMRATGMQTWWDADALAVMGLAEVLAHLPRLLRLRKQFRERVLAWQPDVFIGIDAPDFNLGVERWLKQRGVRTVHDVSPSIWAWRQGRAAKIGESADRVLCLFPMEPPIYAQHGVAARFIGHPLADAIPLQPDRAAARAALGESSDTPILALLPGSRLGEIRRMLPDFVDAARRLAAGIPGLRVLVPAANAQCRAAIDAILGDAPAFRVIDGQAQQIMIASDVVLLASGTAALEAMLCKRPMVIGHRISALTYRIVKLFGLLKSAHVSLPNVLAGKTLVPELLQDQCTADNLHRALLHWFTDADAVAALQPQFLTLHESLRCDASARAAEAVAEVLQP
ncbi:lipid-A-disaccharide synthase [Thermomonas sp.]|uniref:lipid-A-disaccharide synthase n=1 Tax=Thermomonas sp. TaxID=1971895 RepID=UPI003782E3E1